MILDRQGRAGLAIALGLWIAPGCVSTAHQDHDQGGHDGAAESAEQETEVAEQAPAEEMVFEIVRLEYASAPELSVTLQRLVHNANGGAGARTAVLADERTNSLLISGPVDHIHALKELVAELDVQSGHR